MVFKKTDTFIGLNLELPDGTLVGTAEVSPDKKMLERFVIFEPYQNKGYGQEALRELIDKYGIESLWVRSDNPRAIHVYEKFGFKRWKETMFEMRREDN